MTPNVFWHEDQQDVLLSTEALKGLGPFARKFLAEVVTDQSVVRERISKTAQKLEQAGFLKIRDTNPPWGPFEMSPTLIGEEALEWLDEGWA